MPDAPVVISYGSPYTLCFSVDYEGQYKVLKYLANVTDNTRYTLSIEVSPSSRCKTLHLDSNNCGSITVRSQSENVLGRSLISSYVLNQGEILLINCIYLLIVHTYIILYILILLQSTDGFNQLLKVL